MLKELNPNHPGCKCHPPTCENLLKGLHIYCTAIVTSYIGKSMFLIIKSLTCCYITFTNFFPTSQVVLKHTQTLGGHTDCGNKIGQLRTHWALRRCGEEA